MARTRGSRIKKRGRNMEPFSVESINRRSDPYFRDAIATEQSTYQSSSCNRVRQASPVNRVAAR